jgi:ATP-binding protein involved in chromosome partitioning
MGELNTGGPAPGQERPREVMLPEVRRILAISSGKGGVGKSTVAVNLAVALTQTGARVGLMDADVYGPNIPMMMGISKPPEQQDGKIKPAERYGVKVMSMGFFVPEDTALVWRGPMVHTAIQQFFRDVLWGELEYLLIDLPPGTGDAQLTLSQLVPLCGAITVTTPQAVALYDVRKGVRMFQKVNVPLLGLVENMSFFVCGHCGTRTEIFASGGGERAAAQLGVPFLGRVPIDPSIRAGGDAGEPIVVAAPGSASAQAFQAIAAALVTQVEGPGEEQTSPSLARLVEKLKRPLGGG